MAYFERNLLLPDSIGFSPLFQAHPKGFHNRIRASTSLSRRFTLAWNRSSGFRSYSSDFPRFHTAPLTSCEVAGLSVSLRLPLKLTLPLEHTPYLFFRNARHDTVLANFHAMTDYDHIVSDSFQRLLRLLFNFPSPY